MISCCEDPGRVAVTSPDQCVGPASREATGEPSLRLSFVYCTILIHYDNNNDNDNNTNMLYYYDHYY